MLTSYLRWWKLQARSEATVRNYVYALRRFAVHLGGEDRLARATRDELEEWLAGRLDEVSAATVSVEYRAVRSYFGWLADEGERVDNPAKGLRGPRVVETPVPVADELTYKRLLATTKGSSLLDRRDAVILALLWHGGLRRGELVVCDVTDVDLDAGVVEIPTTKGGRPRRVALHPEAVGLLDRYLRRRGPDDGPLLLAERGGRLTSNGIGQVLHRRGEIAGVTVSAHSFRRALAVRWLRAEGSTSGLMAHAGWRSEAMVRRYTRMSAEELAHAEYRRLLG